MHSILLLLIAFSLVGLLSRFGGQVFAQRVFTGLIAVAVGFVLSKHGLGIIRLNTLDRIDLFTQVSLTLLGLTWGLLSLYRRKITRNLVLSVISGSILYGLILVILFLIRQMKIYWLVDQYWFLDDIYIYLVASLVLAQIFFCFHFSVVERNIAIILMFANICSHIIITNNTSEILSLNSLLLVLAGPLIAGFGLLISNIIYFSQKNKKDKHLTLLIVLIVVSLITGAALYFNVPQILVGFIFGWLLAKFYPAISLIKKELIMSELSLRIVFLILLGAQLKWTFDPIFWGLVLGLALLLLFIISRRWINQFYGGHMSIRGSGGYEIGVLFAASIMFASQNQATQLNNVVLFMLAFSLFIDVTSMLWFYYSKARLSV